MSGELVPPKVVLLFLAVFIEALDPNKADPGAETLNANPLD